MTGRIETGAVRTRNLGRRFTLRKEGPRSLRDALRGRRAREQELWALRAVDLDIAPGETFGVVGKNGSGKSTLLKLLAGIFAQSEGTVEVGGRVGSLLEVSAGFHPEFSGVENVYLNAAIHGLPRRYVEDHLEEILAFAELEEFAHMPVRTYSTGMFLRLGFSVAIHLEPSVLLVDEVLAVGDEAFQHKCFGKIAGFRERGGTLIFVSHAASAVERLCKNAILLEEGRIVERGSAPDVLLAYHQRLSGEPAAAAWKIEGQIDGPCSILGTRALRHDGTVSERFVEAESVVIEAVIGSETGLRSALVVIGLRDPSGHAVGAQHSEPIDVPAGQPTVVRLRIPSLPLRDGRYAVDVTVLNHTMSDALASRLAAMELSIFSRDAHASGPIRLGGEWETPAQNVPWRQARSGEPAQDRNVRRSA